MDKTFEQELAKEKVKFFFVVDRSGSMRSRIHIAVQALELFLMSLPKDCGF